MVGAAQRVFDLTLRYTRERSQFGQPLLRFQSLNFRLAALLTRIDGARLLTYHAAWLIDRGQAFAHAALFAKAQAAEVYREMAAEAIQMHGGFGFTAEANPQLFYRRAAADAVLLGGATSLRERIAGYLELS
jgi:alkylation response protein AidB-like acyl-CoA dehydrogenase